MRSKLKKFENFRFTYVATFKRFGKVIVSGREYETILFTDLKNTFGDYICDHIWIRKIKKFKDLDLKTGDKVMFSAICKKYQRGYKGESPLYPNYKITFDYKLINFKKIRKIT